MENRDTKKAIPEELNDGTLEAVTAGGTVPTVNPEVMYAKPSDPGIFTPIPSRDQEGNLIYIIPTTTE